MVPGPIKGVMAYANREDELANKRRYYKEVVRDKIKRTHCIRGHELTDDNVYAYVSKQGHNIRDCKTCAKDKYQRRASQVRENHLNRKFGITQEQYEQMLEAQGGKCALCPRTEPGGMGSFHIDHCHTTGKIRKLLCTKCNSCLGQADDDPERLEAMAKYIREHQILELEAMYVS